MRFKVNYLSKVLVVYSVLYLILMTSPLQRKVAEFGAKYCPLDPLGCEDLL